MPSPEQRTEPYSQSYGEGVQREAYVEATTPTSAAPLPVAPIVPPDLLGDVLASTDRPDVPIMSGVAELEDDEIRALQRWGPLLQEMAAQEDASPALRDLALKAAAAYR